MSSQSTPEGGAVIPYLTPDEHALIRKLGECANLFGYVVGNGPTRSADLNEMVHHVHILQQAVLSQAAGRTYPSEYRLLGESLHDPVTTP